MDAMTKEFGIKWLLLTIRYNFMTTGIPTKHACSNVDNHLSTRMKSHLCALLAAVCVIAASPCHAQTLNWGNQFGDRLTDSEGNLLDSTFTFELGAFPLAFVPDETNVNQWLANWMMFDTAEFNPGAGYFTGEVFILEDVTSSNPSADPSSFAGLVAYLWIRDNDQPIPGSEWLLVRSDQWAFPLTGGDCCDTSVIEWSVSDLDGGDMPEWGRQGTPVGPGSYTTNTSTNSSLQTFTFVPEPSTALLTAITGLGMALRRKRSA